MLQICYNNVTRQQIMSTWKVVSRETDPLKPLRL